MGDAAGGEEEDGGEGGDAIQQAEEGGPERGSCGLPPLLDVGDVEDAGRRPLGLTEHLRGAENGGGLLVGQLRLSWINTMYTS